MARVGRPKKFRHDKNTAVLIRGKRRLLKQDDTLFTNAEFNRFSKRWEPEPQPVDMEELWEMENKGKVEQLEKEIAEKQKEIEAILASKP